MERRRVEWSGVGWGRLEWRRIVPRALSPPDSSIPYTFSLPYFSGSFLSSRRGVSLMYLLASPTFRCPGSWPAAHLISAVSSSDSSCSLSLPVFHLIHLRAHEQLTPQAPSDVGPDHLPNLPMPWTLACLGLAVALCLSPLPPQASAEQPSGAHRPAANLDNPREGLVHGSGFDIRPFVLFHSNICLIGSIIHSSSFWICCC